METALESSAKYFPSFLHSCSRVLHTVLAFFDLRQIEYWKMLSSFSNKLRKLLFSRSVLFDNPRIAFHDGTAPTTVLTFAQKKKITDISSVVLSLIIFKTAWQYTLFTAATTTLAAQVFERDFFSRKSVAHLYPLKRKKCHNSNIHEQKHCLSYHLKCKKARNYSEVSDQHSSNQLLSLLKQLQ